MVRILYGVAGEGMGHAIRSKPIIEHLIKKNKLIIVTSRKPYDFLKKNFNNVYDIHGLHLNYKNNKVQNMKTFFSNMYKLPKGSYYSIKKLMKLIKEFKPEVLISDFEPFTHLVSRLYQIPLISIDNMHVMTNCKIKIPKRYYKDYLAARVIVKSFVSKADYFLINTFFYPKVKKKNTYLFPPILRPEILKAKTLKGNHIMVYQTSKTDKRLMKSLSKIDEKFIVYNFDYDKKLKNVILKKFDEKEFVDDLASCKAFIVNGGFTAISEAVYLGKPVLSVPIKKQFEQILNAIFIDELGYGEFHKKLKVKSIEKFISNIDDYRKNLKKYKKEDNKRILKKLDSILNVVKS